MPQGLLKKIEFTLLLADLAFELGNALAGGRKIPARLKIKNSKSPARTTRRPQRLSSAMAKVRTPLMQMPSPKPQFARNRRRAFPTQNPLHRR
jgi:hypothetical protein